MPAFCGENVPIDTPNLVAGSLRTGRERQTQEATMAVQGPFKIDSAEMFPHGLGVVSAVTARHEFGAGTKENPVQERDKTTGLPIWGVDVMDFDPEARERTFKVKIIAA